MAQEMLNKYTEQGHDPEESKSLKSRLSKLAYGGYNGGTGSNSGNNAELCYQLLKSHPEIFFTCAEYHYRYSSPYDSAYFAAEWHNILNNLVEDKKITYEQALEDVKEINAGMYKQAQGFAKSEYQLDSFEKGILSYNRIVDRSEEIDVDEDER